MNTLNGNLALSTRLFIPQRGVWFADVDLDPTLPLTPIGPAALIIGTTSLIGTIDPQASGRFVNTVKVRVLGGGGGWQKQVPAQHFHSDGGVLSPQVTLATAALVGEVAIDAVPILMGATDWLRSAGPASRVLLDRDWHVDFTGSTQIAPRLPALPPISLEVLSYDPITQTIEAACDDIIQPGTPLIDTNPVPRWDGALTVVDVDQTFDAKGSRATLYCSSTSASRLTSALTSMVRELSNRDAIRAYQYRFVVMVGGKVALQAVDPTSGIPDIIPLDVWGAAGESGTYAPGAQVAVAFLNGDKGRPVIFGWDPTLPLTKTVDATVELDLGPTAPVVNIAGGANALVPAPWAQALLAAFAAATPSMTETGLAAIKLALASPAFPPAATIKTKAT